MVIKNKRELFEMNMEYFLKLLPEKVLNYIVDIVFEEFTKFNKTFIEEVSLLELKENIRNSKYSFVKSNYHEDIISLFSDDKLYIKKFAGKDARYNLHYSSNMYNIQVDEKDIFFSSSIIVLTRKGAFSSMEGVSYIDTSKRCSSVLIVNCNNNVFPMVLIHEISHIIGEQIISLFSEELNNNFLKKSAINHELMAEFITHLVLKRKCSFDDEAIKVLIKKSCAYIESVRSKEVFENFELIEDVVEKYIKIGEEIKCQINH